MTGAGKEARDRVLVSVVMPAYNAERFIEDAVRSVQAQSFRDWELLVIDDGSTDRTVEIVRELARQDERITVIRNESNLGVAKTRNRGFDLSRGAYVALLDSDDLWYPEKLERQIALAREENADVVYCSYGIIDENGNKKCDDFLVSPVTDFQTALIKSEISCSTALLSRKVIDTYRFNPGYYHEDLVLWLQILQDGGAARGVPEVLAAYRVMDGSRASNKLKSAARRWQVYRELLGYSIPKSVKLLLQYGLLGLKKYNPRGNNAKG